MMELQEKRDGLELAVLFKSDAQAIGREAILRAFERTLADYVAELLSPGLDDASVLHVRAKALGVLDVLTKMGGDITQAMEKAPVKRSVSRAVNQSLGTMS